jgi:hypothetical protein
MSLPEAWVKALFSRLTVRYGEAFFRQYAGIDPAVVQADWAQVLDGASGHSIEYALRNLPSDWPPTALKFRDLCRQAPAKPVPAEQRLGYTPEKRDPQRVAAMVAQVQMKAREDRRNELTPAERCYVQIMSLTNDGKKLSPPQKAQIEAMRNAGLLRRYFPEEVVLREEAAVPIEAISA